MEKKAIRTAYGETLKKIGEKNKDIVVLDGDLSHSTMTAYFKKAFPERFFNMGIAEQNLMATAAGLAIAGKIPFVSTFAIFGTGRAYDQVRNSIAYANLNVKIALTHAGITVGEDGGSHQSIEDIALMRSIPNMIILSPSDAIETEKAVIEMARVKSPVYLRMGRSATTVFNTESTPFIIGKANILKEGKDICIFATGIMVYEALKTAELFKKDNISVSVVNIHTIKPLDRKTVLEMAISHKTLVSVEEHSIIGGLGSAIAEVLTEECPKKLIRLGINDVFGESGTSDELLKLHRLTSEDIYASIISKS